MKSFYQIFPLRGLVITIALFLFFREASGQQQDIIRNHRWLTMIKRELHPTKFQLNKLMGIDKYITAKVYYFDHHYPKKTAAKKSEELFKQQRNKILSVLTREQQERAVMILDQQPRRGVTDMPNE